MDDLQVDSVVCSYQRDFKLIYVNSSCCRFFGKTRSQLLGTDISKLISAADREVLRQQVASLSPENPIRTFEDEHVSPEGVVSRRLWQNSAVFDSRGRITMYQTIFRDTTEHRDSRSGLGESENRYRAVVEDQAELVCAQASIFR